MLCSAYDMTAGEWERYRFFDEKKAYSTWLRAAPRRLAVMGDYDALALCADLQPATSSPLTMKRSHLYSCVGIRGGTGNQPRWLCVACGKLKLVCIRAVAAARFTTTRATGVGCA